MEEDQRNNNIDNKKLKLKTLLISKPEEVANDGASTSYEDKKKAEDAILLTEKEDDPNESTPTPHHSSPEPSCAICLEQLTNKSFTNSCFHMFCFTCLVEWSKVKPECPLCKQTFTTIVHNVRSFQEFDQYHINRERTPESLWGFDRRFRYNTTMTSDRAYNYPSNNSSSESARNIENEIASHRMRFAPHSVHSSLFPRPTITRRIPCIFRRLVYEEVLWVRPQIGTRIRSASQFFRQNIDTNRLLHWLNRELLVIMSNNESQISFLIELIMALIIKYSITSQEFFAHIEPYTMSYTRHFIHEFYNFAVSPYDMEAYDIHAQYATLPNETIRLSSSPDSDVVPLPTPSEPSRKSIGRESKRKKKHHSARKQHMSEIKDQLAKIVLKRNSENNCWETVANSLPLLNFSDVSSVNSEIPGPSTSRNSLFPSSTTETSIQEVSSQKTSEVESVQDDECQIVDVLKPKHERTPEVLDLSSEEEPVQRPLAIPFSPYTYGNTCSIDIEVSSSINGSLPFTGIIDVSSDQASSGGEDDIIFLSEKRAPTVITTTSDKPIDYSLKPADKTIEIESKDEEEPATTSEKDNTKSEQKIEPKKTLKSTVRVISNDNDTGSSSWSPLAKPKKRRATILDDSSTESCPESTQVSELDSRIKKLKLRSVAHFSFDPSDELSDTAHLSSSHKGHKEKKKKKRKHKHRHRIYSSDSS